MSFLDLLLAEAIASGLARAAAEAQRPPPENFFVLPPDPEAWKKIRSSCKEENMVICVEVTDDDHPGSRQVQPLFMDLARELPQIPFFRVKVGFGRAFKEVRDDLGGVEKVPTVLVVFFDDENVRIAQVEGAAEVRQAIRSGGLERVIKQYVDRRMKLKIAERLAGALFVGAIAGQVARRRQAQLEYEENLRKNMQQNRRDDDEDREGRGLIGLLERLRMNDKK